MSKTFHLTRNTKLNYKFLRNKNTNKTIKSDFLVLLIQRLFLQHDLRLQRNRRKSTPKVELQ